MSEEKELSPVVLTGKEVESIVSALSSVDSLINTVTDGLDSNTKMGLDLILGPIKLSHLGIAAALGSEAFAQYFAKQEEADAKIKKSHEEKEENSKNDALEALSKLFN